MPKTTSQKLQHLSRNMSSAKHATALAHTMSVDDLATFIVQCRDAYYNSGRALVDDDVYDALEETLRQRDAAHPLLCAVGAPPASRSEGGKGERSIALPYWMGSLDKFYPERDEDRFRRWCASHPAAAGAPVTDKKPKTHVVCSVKLDGVSGMLIVERGQAFLYSRGDGARGSDWSAHLTHLRSLRDPIYKLAQELRGKERVVIRGELIIARATFAAHSDAYATARAMVNGLLGAYRAPKPSLLAHIHFVCYEILELRSQSGATWPLTRQLSFLEKRGFQTVLQCGAQAATKNPTFDELRVLYDAWRRDCDYDMDGVVVSVDAYRRNSTGNPKYAFAFKLHAQDQMAETEVVDVVWNVSRHMYLKPVVEYAPVVIGGATYQRATALHYKYVVDNCLGPGSKIVIVRNGDVIPGIARVLTGATSGQPALPAQPYTLSASGIDAIATETTNEAAETRLLFFFKTLRVRQVSEKMAALFVEHAMTDALEIMAMPSKQLQARILGWSGVQSKTAETVAKNLQRARDEEPIERWLVASNCMGRGVGIVRLREVLAHYPGLLDWPSTTLTAVRFEKLCDTKRRGLREALAAVKGFQTTTIEHLCQRMENVGTWWQHLTRLLPHVAKRGLSALKSLAPSDHHARHKGGVLEGQRVLLTGFRDPGIVNRLCGLGGEVAKSVTSATLVLRPNERYENKKTQAALAKNVPVHTASEWKSAASSDQLRSLFE